MTPLRSYRSLLAIVMILAVVSVGFDASVGSAEDGTGRPPGVAAVGASTPAHLGPDGVMPTRSRPAVDRAPERSGRLKVVLLVAVAVAVWAVAPSRRLRSRYERGSPLPLALRWRSAPLRGPPPLAFG